MLTSPRATVESRFVELLPLIERVIAFVTRTHHASWDEAEEFASYVKEKLIDNDYAVLRKFEGRSSVETFLTSVILHRFQDFRNHRWGKWRPSTAARREGPAAVLLEQYLVRDGLGFDEACAAMAASHGVSIPTSELERIAGRLPVRFRRRMLSEEALAEMATPDRADDGILADERDAVVDRAMGIIAAERAKLQPQDALILALRLDDGKKISEIAAILQVPQRPLYERIGKILATIRRALEGAGIDAETVRDVLEDKPPRP